MTWFDFSWIPGFFTHEDLDVRTVAPVTIVNGRRVPGFETPVPQFVGNFHPVSGQDAEKSDDGQHIKADGILFSAIDVPISDNELSPSEPGARLYYDDRIYEFVHREWWASGAYYRYKLRLRTRLTPEPDEGNGNGGGGGGG